MILEGIIFCLGISRKGMRGVCHTDICFNDSNSIDVTFIQDSHSSESRARETDKGTGGNGKDDGDEVMPTCPKAAVRGTLAEAAQISSSVNEAIPFSSKSSEYSPAAIF